jgi:hypothetical protein
MWTAVFRSWVFERAQQVPFRETSVNVSVSSVMQGLGSTVLGNIWKHIFVRVSEITILGNI